MKQRCSLPLREGDVPQAFALKFAHFPGSGSLSLTLPGTGPVVMRESAGSSCPALSLGGCSLGGARDHHKHNHDHEGSVIEVMLSSRCHGMDSHNH
jgi:hypothetical protein